MKLNELYEGTERTYKNAFKTTWEIGNNIDCARQFLVGLDGAPDVVNGNFDCDKNQLSSLEGGPSRVTGDFSCNDNDIGTLEFCPKYIGGDFFAMRCGLTDLHNIHKKIDYIFDTFVASRNPIKSHVLGLLKIKGLQAVRLENNKVSAILNAHLLGLPADKRDILKCQQVLIDNGFEEYAKL